MLALGPPECKVVAPARSTRPGPAGPAAVWRVAPVATVGEAVMVGAAVTVAATVGVGVAVATTTCTAPDDFTASAFPARSTEKYLIDSPPASTGLAAGS